MTCAIVVNEAEADTVRLIFQRYLALGCVSRLRVDLDRQGVRSKQRILTSGRVLGGASFGRGALYHLLRNRIYRGEVLHKGIAYPAEHEAIVNEELWNAVQARLSGNLTRRGQSRLDSGVADLYASDLLSPLAVLASARGDSHSDVIAVAIPPAHRGLDDTCFG